MLVNVLVKEYTDEEGEKVFDFTQIVLPEESSDQETLSEVKKVYRQEVDSRYEEAIGWMTKDYPSSEIQSWERQRDEAITWKPDPSHPTPWIDVAAEARGLDRTVYLERTLAKINAFTLESARLTGLRQKYSDMVYAATSLEEIQTLVCSYD